MQKPTVILLLCCAFFGMLSSCAKYHDPGSDQSRLPLETQTGANTFGCVINGKVFLPFAKSKLLNYQDPLWCTYSSNINNGNYTFGLSAFNDSDDYSEPSVMIQTTSLVLKQGQAYTLSDSKAGNIYAEYELFSNHNFYEYYTSNQVTGQLYISKLDTINHIIAGTFSFNAVNIRGGADTVHVTLGRFDMKYK